MPGNELFFKTSFDNTGVRIDTFLSEKCSELSRSFVQTLINECNVKVNDKPVKCSYKLKNGDMVYLLLPELKEPEIAPENLPLDIIYEDDDFAIINKPKGMVVHPAPGHYEGTLVNALMYHFGDTLSGINGVKRPGIVHRIDKDTTGSLIICKNDKSHKIIAEQLKEHSITRKYRAIVLGKFKEKKFSMENFIGRDTKDRKKMSVKSPNGKRAVTEVEVLEELNGYSYIECTLKTGRTHQIRVQLSSVGHPVLGDTVYGPAKSPVKNLQGQTLHAYRIGFVHPTTGDYVEFIAPLPEYFDELLERLRYIANH